LHFSVFIFRIFCTLRTHAVQLPAVTNHLLLHLLCKLFSTAASYVKPFPATAQTQIL